MKMIVSIDSNDRWRPVIQARLVAKVLKPTRMEALRQPSTVRVQAAVPRLNFNPSIN